MESSSFDRWEQEFRREHVGRTMVLPPMPPRAVTAPGEWAPSPYRTAHRGAELRAERRAERRRHRAEWLWGIVGGVSAAAPVLAVVWVHSGR